MTNQADVIKAAAAVQRDVTTGKLDPADLDRAVETRCRRMVGTVIGPGDALWPLHVDITRQVLGLGGITADELTEWLAVARAREQASQQPEETP